LHYVAEQNVGQLKKRLINGIALEKELNEPENCATTKLDPKMWARRFVRTSPFEFSLACSRK
jgi:hypothetical protein